MNSRIGRNLSVILRSERLMAQRRLALVQRRTTLTVVAAIFAGIGLVLLNVAAVYALLPVLGPAMSSLVIALVNLALAGVLIAIVARSSVDREIAPLAEVRDMAVEDLEAEFDKTTEEARELVESVHRIARNPLGTAGLGILGPLLELLMKNLKK
ncbi:phage holin family protein [Tropicimonas marinistellae]|uniref:phage holin family protein n=1 Tax=Tropicimonas marinistellae TaxID=1739787 RepID=UPI000834A480|nr:phage holin family protein [Tropicimonas marinistellae]